MVDTISSSLFVVTPEEETTMGKQFAGEIEKGITIYDKDPAATAYIDSLGQRLVKSAEPCSQTFTFKIVDNEEVNAFAIPGGYCYVQIGLIRLAKNEGELASVMAHEIAHVTARHGAKDISRSKAYDAAGQFAAGATGAADKSAVLSDMAVKVVKSGILLQHSKEDEFEADALAVKTLAKAGLDPDSLAAFFQQMDPSAKRGDTPLYSTLLSTHPPTGERIAAARKLAKSAGSGPWSKDSAGFQDIKRRFPAQGQ
jgi:predicted Zn-dependent protease